MPINIRWVDDEKTIILSEHIDSWTLTQFIETSNERGQMMDSVNHIVASIVHHTKGSSPPASLVSNLGKFRNDPALTHPNGGMAIAIIDNNPIMASLLNIFLQLTTKRVAIAKTIEEAIEMVYASRSVPA